MVAHHGVASRAKVDVGCAAPAVSLAAPGQDRGAGRPQPRKELLLGLVTGRKGSVRSKYVVLAHANYKIYKN